MEHNPLKPDEKRPWCKKCRAHTSCARGQHGVVGYRILKCDRCEGEMLKNAYGMTHSSRLGCIVPALRVLGVLLLIAGVLLFVPNHPRISAAAGAYIMAIFFLAFGLGFGFGTNFSVSVFINSTLDSRFHFCSVPEGKFNVI